MSLVRLPLVLLLTGLVSLVGCVSQQPVPLYQLDSGKISVPADKDGIAVLLGPVSIADYLQRETLLQRQADGSLIAASGVRWAGSLAAELDQQLLRQLASRLDSQRLVLSPAEPGFTPQVQVLLTIARLDSGPQQPAVLDAQWRLMSKDGQLIDGRMVHIEEAHEGSIADQVRAQSLAVQQLVGQLADAIETSSSTPVAVTPPAAKKPAPTPAAKEPPPKIPMAQPIRIDSEVYRF